MSDYAKEKKDSEKEDQTFGFQIDSVEAIIRDRLIHAPQIDKVSWSHLSPQIFQTPYAELRRIVLEADPNKTVPSWVDLGAGYGRLGIVLSRLRPSARFTGIEFVPERVEEGRRVYSRLGLNPSSLICADLSTYPVPKACAYFIYDFGTRGEIEITLNALKSIALRFPIIVIGRGRAIRDAVEKNHPWLGSVISPLHFAHHSVYRSA